MKLTDIIVLNEQPGNAENKSFKKAPPVTGDTMSTAQAAKELGVTPSRIRQLKMELFFTVLRLRYIVFLEISI